MDKQIQKHLKKLDQQEQRFLAQKNSRLLDAASKKLDKIIPELLKSKLQLAFYQGFKLVFSKGTVIIEKSYHKDQLKRTHETENFAFHNNLKKRALKKMDQSAKLGTLATLSFASLEGAVLGLFGVGLPDILLFIAVLLKGIYEISLKYGYSYENEQEQYYILLIIELALSTENTVELNKKLDLTAAQIDRNQLPPIDLNHQIEKTANALAMDLLYLKFIQGFPIVGVIGGASNAVYFHKITKFAHLKYKKRYLSQKESS